MRFVLTTGSARDTLEIEDGDSLLENPTIKAILNRYGADYNISPEAVVTPLLNGEPATVDDVVHEGDELAANKPAGRKG